MSGRSRLASVACCACACALPFAAAARAADHVTITQARFSPNLVGVPTVAIGSAVISSTEGPVPSPITHVNVFGPAGVTLDLTGSETCSEATLMQRGPSGCPANSKAGEGGGEGVYELAKELIKEPYVVDFFLSDNRPGHVALTVDIIGYHPVALEVVFPGKVVHGPKPYGLGFSLEVPLIKVLPEASDASASTASLKLGAKGQTYTKVVHGHRHKLPIRGIVLPNKCPHGGWPIETQLSFQDGSTVTAKKTIPCPHR